MIQSVGVVSLATNRYVRYWKELAKSADALLFPECQVTLHVFTDQIAEVESFASSLHRVHVNALPIGSLTWPDAPLQKFQVISDHADQLTQDVLMHLDADMLVVGEVLQAHLGEDWPGELALVRHPGYRRPSGRLLTQLYLRHPMFIARDLVRRAREGALGTWEHDPNSAAYVPRSLRRSYVCGATWMAGREPFLDACRLLAARTQRDGDKGIVALWHDESHMNWFAATQPCSILDSDFCFVVGAPNLIDLSPRILAVEKLDDRTR